jgi:hypothetical protein
MENVAFTFCISDELILLIITPSRLVQAITLLTCIREVPDLNLGRDTAKLTEGFGGFPQPLLANDGIKRDHPIKLSIHYHPAIRRHIFWASDSVVK